MKVRGCSRVSQIHNTFVEIVNELTEDTMNVHLETLRKFSVKHLFISHESSRWPHGKLPVLHVATFISLAFITLRRVRNEFVLR
jgi:hypothetical protein